MTLKSSIRSFFFSDSFWERVSDPADIVKIHLDTLEGIEELSFEDQRAIVEEMQARLDRGEIPGDAPAVEQLRSRLFELDTALRTEESLQDLAQVEGLALGDAELSVEMARESLLFEIEVWAEEWHQIIRDKFERTGSPFFAEGGAPHPQIARTRLALEIAALQSLVTSEMHILSMALRLWREGEEPPPSVVQLPLLLKSLRSELRLAMSRASVSLDRQYDIQMRYFGMVNLTNFLNQYVMGMTFALIGAIVANPVTWLSLMTTAGREGLWAKRMKKAQRLQQMAVEVRQPWMYLGYSNVITRLNAVSSKNLLLGKAKTPSLLAPPGPAGTGLRKVEKQMLSELGALPEGYVAGLPASARREIVNFSALSMVMIAALEVEAKAIIEATIPGRLAELEESLRGLSEGEAIPKIDAWIEEQRPALEEALAIRAAAIAEEQLEEIGPTLEHAEELGDIELAAWAQEAILFYNGIQEVSPDYAMMVMLLSRLETLAGSAPTAEAHAWIDGLIVAARAFVDLAARELGVFLPDDYFEIGLPETLELP